MSISKVVILDNDRAEIRALKESYNKRADEAAALEEQLNNPNNPAEMVDTIKASIDNINAECENVLKVLESADANAVSKRSFDPLKAYNALATFHIGGKEEEKRNMKNSTEMRAFQQFISNGMRSATETEKRALTVSGSAAVIPKTIADTLITDQKYSDLLHRANIFDMPHMGKLSIPIASNGSAVVHTEGAELADGTPGLNYLELTGFEVVGLATMSRSTVDMATESFMQKMIDFVSAEVVEKLEDLFINGSGNAEPKGLVNLDWTENNSVAATTSINIGNVAAALALLPQRYARNAVILCNTKTYYDLMVTQDQGGYVFNMDSGAEKILGKEVVVSELVPNETVFVVDPYENYVNFAAPLTAESDASSGFTKHLINVKAWATMDNAWNPAACVKIAVA